MKFNDLKSRYLENSRAYLYVERNKKYTPILFFSFGFVWDWITLERVDKLSDIIILTAYIALLSLCLFLANVGENLRFGKTLIKKYNSYFPFAIQFFLGGLASAYVIYFSRSVSLSKTLSFFVILVLLFIANELFKKRISNIYFQFGFYAFVSFTFFAYMIPVLTAVMNTLMFIVSGILSFLFTYFIIYLIYKINSTLNKTVSKIKLLAVVISVYSFITIFYFFKLIPPLPLALDKSLVADFIEKTSDIYEITYEKEHWYVFWREHKREINIAGKDKIFVFTSIFAPTDLDKKVYHVWHKFNPKTDEYDVTDRIGFEITGGRNDGYRGYSLKQNISEGEWKVDVVTEEELIIGVVKFMLYKDENESTTVLETIQL